MGKLSKAFLKRATAAASAAGSAAAEVLQPRKSTLLYTQRGIEGEAFLPFLLFPEKGRSVP